MASTTLPVSSAAYTVSSLFTLVYEATVAIKATTPVSTVTCIVTDYTIPASPKNDDLLSVSKSGASPEWYPGSQITAEEMARYVLRGEPSSKNTRVLPAIYTSALNTSLEENSDRHFPVCASLEENSDRHFPVCASSDFPVCASADEGNLRFNMINEDAKSPSCFISEMVVLAENANGALSVSLRGLVRENYLSDILLKTSDGEVIPAHRLLLLLRCPGLSTRIANLPSQGELFLDENLGLEIWIYS